MRLKRVVNKPRPSLQGILLAVSLIFLLMPLGGIYFLRIYESALIRQTETELISQAAFIAALYRHAVLKELSTSKIDGYGQLIANPGKPEALHPIPAYLDLAKERIYPPRPQPQQRTAHLDVIAQRAGKAILPILKDAQRITLSGIKVLDYQGLVAAGQSEVGLSFAHTEEFKQARTGRPVSLIRRRVTDSKNVPLDSMSRGSKFNVFVGLPVVSDGRLLGVVWLNRTPTDLMSALYGKQTELGWMAFFIALATLLITAFTALTVTRPVQGLVHKSRLIAAGDPAGVAPLKHPATRELAELADALAIMAETLQQRTDYLKNFTAHLSHEFKTPLTAIQGSVELLQDNLADMSEEQRRRFLGNIAADAERRLVARLMDLARADMSEMDQTQPVQLRPILSRLQKHFEVRGLALDLRDSFETVAIVPEILEAALMNLLENSLQAGADRVTLELGKNENGLLMLSIQDNGPGISEANRASLFTPFFTTRREQGGTGLGLTITQSLLDRQGGKIYHTHSESGARFVLELPRV